MLILSRKVGDSIRIGDDVEVIVLRSSRGRVQLGLRAPQTVRVVRSELEDLGSDEEVTHASA